MTAHSLSSQHEGILFIISACSGAGKTTLVKGVLSRLGSKYALERVITYTTRAPRPGELNGDDYYFVSNQEFERKVEEGFFMEWSHVYGAYYGSPRSALSKLAQGISLLLVLDQDGFSSLLRLSLAIKIVGIWIAVSSLDTLKTRLLKRGERTELASRLALAQKETGNTALINLYNYKIINDKEHKALASLSKIITSEISQEGCKTFKRQAEGPHLQQADGNNLSAL